MLGLLLLRATPPILLNTSVAEVHMQTRHLGWCTDDLLVVGCSGEGDRRQLALQAKRTFTISKGDVDCRNTIRGMWKDFQSSERFNPTLDCLAVVTLRGTYALNHYFSSLLECARATSDAQDFAHRLSLSGYLSSQAKKQNEIVRAILDADDTITVSEHDYWRFLRSIYILNFDLNTATSQDAASLMGLLSFSAVETTDPLSAAQSTWFTLLQCAAEARPTAKSFTRNDLPKDVLGRHSFVPSADTQSLAAIIDHGETIRDNIRTSIGNNYELDRSSYVMKVIEKLDEHQAVVITGSAGSGKSAVAKQVTDALSASYPVFAFSAVELSKPHLDETLALAGTPYNAQRLFALLAGHHKKILLIESVERLLEHSTRDAFSQLLKHASNDSSVHLVLTVRDYSLETVRQAFLETAGLAHDVFELPNLSEEELAYLKTGIPELSPALEDNVVRSFLTTPYIVDIAARLDWSKRLIPKTILEFRQKCWKEVICAESFAADGMPRRRERTFVDLAHLRATSLRPFVRPDTPDHKALDALRRDSLLVCSPSTQDLFAPSHDVLEDWAILQWFDSEFDITDYSFSEVLSAVEGYPALRRTFRRWLDERFQLDPETAQRFVLRAAEATELPDYFRDDCLVSTLLSNSARTFLNGCKARIRQGDLSLLVRIIHTLRVACKESPSWLNVPGLPSQALIASGTGWEPTLELVADILDELPQEQDRSILGLIEDWASQITWYNTEPSGFKAVGRIACHLISRFTSYYQTDARKRLLKVAALIPHVVPPLPEALERAKTCDHTDTIANDAAELVLSELSCRQVCHHFPAHVMALIEARFYITDADLERRHDIYYSEPIEVDCNFGLREAGVSGFFPASAHQGPFRELLDLHPIKTVPFLLGLVNHAGEWYGEQRWPGRSLEPAQQITLKMPDGKHVSQWMNGRLYHMYRGTSVGPYLVQSALMALESWLLTLAEKEGVDLDGWLLYILRESNNVMATAVVASVCNANISKCENASLTLLSSRHIIQQDLARSVSDLSGTLDAFSGLSPRNFVYEQERKESNALEHRKYSLENLAVQMQFIPEVRERVWNIIDLHRSELSEAIDALDETTAIWRLALHRIDIRGYEVKEGTDAELGNNAQAAQDAVVLGPGALEPELEEMVEGRTNERNVLNRHLGLFNSAVKVWRREDGDTSVKWRESLLFEARLVQQELEPPDQLGRGGPGFVAAIGIRDHLTELSTEDLRWCATQIEREVRSSAENCDEYQRYSRSSLEPDRAAASVIGLLLTDERTGPLLDGKALFALALTHPIDEVARFACSGIAFFLDDTQKEMSLLCAGAFAHRARLIRDIREEQVAKPIGEHASMDQLVEQAALSTRQAIERDQIDPLYELGLIESGHSCDYNVVSRILEVLCQHPNWEESRNFASSVLNGLANLWQDGRRDRRHQQTVDYTVEHEILRTIAHMALRLSQSEAKNLLEPILNIVNTEPSKVAKFLTELILAADQTDDDCFWALWQDLADRTAAAPWATDLEGASKTGADLVEKLFLGIPWKDGVKEWRRLNGNAVRLETLARKLPATSSCLLSYLNFLSTVGHNSLPGPFVTVNAMLLEGEGVRMASNSSIAYRLETVVRRFVYSEPFLVKSDRSLQTAILGILDILVTSGSSSAYRMRDDFVTPSVLMSKAHV